MIHIRPFRAWRPTAHTAHLVGSRSFLQYSADELREKLAGNPYTFLQVVYADHDIPGLSRAEHYDRVRAKFLEFVREGIFIREEHPAFFLYEQSSRNFSSRGLIGAVDVVDYAEGRIKRHEQTLAPREQMFSEYLEHTGINAEPVLLAVPHSVPLEALLDQLSTQPTLFDFATTDQVRHRFWKVDDPESTARLQEHFGAMPAAYIADGHHRCASSSLLAAQGHAAPGSAKAAFMAFLVPEGALHIYNYDRTVKGLNGMSPDQFLEALARTGPIRRMDSGEDPPRTGCVQVYVGGAWHELELPPPTTGAPVEQLDAERLNRHVLGPILGIGDLRNEPRVSFVPGVRGRETLARKVDSGKADAAFHLRAVSFAQLCAVADSGACMPPKTTWVEPKLRSGLTIYSLEDV